MICEHIWNVVGKEKICEKCGQMEDVLPFFMTIGIAHTVCAITVEGDEDGE